MPVPVPSSDNALPQWAINALTWFAVALSGILIGIIGWVQRKYILKVDEHEKQLSELEATFATIESVDAMEQKIPGLVSRAEFLAYMKDLREEQLRMHKENLDAGNATRSDIRAVHERVDLLFSNGHDR